MFGSAEYDQEWILVVCDWRMEYVVGVVGQDVEDHESRVRS